MSERPPIEIIPTDSGLKGSAAVQWYDRWEKNFSFEGCEDRAGFHRIAAESLPQLPSPVQNTAPSAGIRLRFRSNTAVLSLKAEIMFLPDMSRMTRAGSHGFDLYVGCDGEVPVYKQTFMPESGSRQVLGEYVLPDGGRMRDFELNFPLYNGVAQFALGLSGNARLQPAIPRRLDKPVIFYGSSITQGGCASRPGNAYVNLLAQQLQIPTVNLGFSGNAKGEPEVARYIASRPMAAFVMDYDNNAESPEALMATHEPFFRIIREAQPSLPIVLLSRPNFDADPADGARRREVVRRTYELARAAGDKRVWFIDGQELFETELRDACTVDGCHPNDLGFYRMYRRIRPVLEEALCIQ